VTASLEQNRRMTCIQPGIGIGKLARMTPNIRRAASPADETVRGRRRCQTLFTAATMRCWGDSINAFASRHRTRGDDRAGSRPPHHHRLAAVTTIFILCRSTAVYAHKLYC